MVGFGISFLLALYSTGLGVGFAQSDEVFLTMGFRVGAVTQSTAVIWTRVCANQERNNDGVSELGRPGPREDQFVEPTVAVEDREGAVPGHPGEVRLVYSVEKSLSGQGTEQTDWLKVTEYDDFTHQFRLSELEPGETYFLKVEARNSAAGSVAESPIGEFTTAAAPRDSAGGSLYGHHRTNVQRPRSP